MGNALHQHGSATEKKSPNYDLLQCRTPPDIMNTLLKLSKLVSKHAVFKKKQKPKKTKLYFKGVNIGHPWLVSTNDQHGDLGTSDCTVLLSCSWASDCALHLCNLKRKGLFTRASFTFHKATRTSAARGNRWKLIQANYRLTLITGPNQLPPTNQMALNIVGSNRLRRVEWFHRNEKPNQNHCCPSFMMIFQNLLCRCWDDDGKKCSGRCQLAVPSFFYHL